jgi:hypothetical protein
MRVLPSLNHLVKCINRQMADLHCLFTHLATLAFTLVLISISTLLEISSFLSPRPHLSLFII